jgi:AraC-like DNA-binding protein
MTAPLGEGDRTSRAPLPHPAGTRTVTAHHVRAALRGAERRGIDTAPLLTAAGIPASLLREEHARLPVDRFAALVRALWAATGDELLGLGAAPSKPGTFAMMCRVAVHGSPDLRTAVRHAAAFYALFPSGPRLRLVEPAGPDDTGGEAAYVEFDTADCDPDPDHFGTETVVVVAHRFACWLIRRHIAPARLEFGYPAPPHAAEYALLFGDVRCHFDAPRTAVHLDRAVLDEPVLQDADGLDAFLRRAPLDVLSRTGHAGPLAARVRALLGRAAGSGGLPGPGDVAARFAISPPTLRRRLAAEGTTFHRIRDEWRRDHAVAALREGRVPIEELAARLGFSEPSAFHRAFRRWTGGTPGSYRPG